MMKRVTYGPYSEYAVARERAMRMKGDGRHYSIKISDKLELPTMDKPGRTFKGGNCWFVEAYLRDRVWTMRKFIEPKGNHGYGVAVAAGEGYVTIGIRQHDGQGEIASFESLGDLVELIQTLRQAQLEAFKPDPQKI